MAEIAAQRSLISPVGYSASSCGYCTAPGSGKRSTAKSSKKYGIWVYLLSPYHYQELIDRGWRRSGDYVYKPDLSRGCCPQIPIRLPVEQFKAGKGQKRALSNLLFQVRQDKPKPAKWKGKWSRGRDWDALQRWDEIEYASAAADGRSHADENWADQVAGPITRRLEVQLQLSSSTDEKYQLFRKYQARVHGESDDQISDKKGFERFLVKTSMYLALPSNGGRLDPDQEEEWRARRFVAHDLAEEIPYGCYHQEYRLDGKLIAVGVLDILPKCVSSVYVFYDPDYNDLQLGKISALQEIALTKRLGQLQLMNGIQYYYMGYYVHNCQKMRYKAEYKPSQLLDCGNNTWLDFAQVKQSLDAGRYFDIANCGLDQGPESSAKPDLHGSHGKEEVNGNNPDRIEDADPDGDEDEDDIDVDKIPVHPKPPPGMLDASLLMQAVEELRAGRVVRMEELELLNKVAVLIAQKQHQGVQPLLMRINQIDDTNVVQALNCVAALADPRLLREMILLL